MANHTNRHVPRRDSIKTFGDCDRTQKVCFQKKKDAKKALAKMYTKGVPGVTNLAVYLCEFCQFHHIGTKRIEGLVVTREKHREMKHGPGRPNTDKNGKRKNH